MSRRLFRFQQFSMTDEHCGMRIGTDAVLLGAWAAAGSGVCHIADIGTGCGIIALMLAQRAAGRCGRCGVRTGSMRRRPCQLRGFAME